MNEYVCRDDPPKGSIIVSKILEAYITTSLYNFLVPHANGSWYLRCEGLGTFI